MRSPSPVIERCRPLLGTFVAIRVGGLAASRAHEAIDAAFQEVALIHRLMSFHEPGSDVSRINRDASKRPVAVHRHTAAVIRQACELAHASDGVFDLTVAAELVGSGVLPVPGGAPRPHRAASWRDIEVERECVRFHRPLWIDLGGIAKGHAVDVAVGRLLAAGSAQICVNAGGDLRVAGLDPERVRLRNDGPAPHAAVIEISNGSIASSSLAPQHVDGRSRGTVHGPGFVSVVAERCMIADGLTKAVLILGEGGAPLLRRYGATAHIQDREGAWRHLGVIAAAA